MTFFRLLQIMHVFAIYHLDEFLKPLPYSFIPRLLIKLHPSYWLYYLSGKGMYTLNERARWALIQLGPVFIKLGQLLATRRDL